MMLETSLICLDLKKIRLFGMGNTTWSKRWKKDCYCIFISGNDHTQYCFLFRF